MAGGNIQYFLIAQENEHQDFSIVPIGLSDYSDKHGYESLKSGKLEKIDLFTTRFSSEEQLIDFLYNDNRIYSKDVKLYIAFQPKKNGNLKFYEVLYNYNNNSDITDLRNIASSNLGIGGDKAYQRAESILRRFYSLADRSDQFYNMLIANMTNIYGKFLEYFKTKNRYDGVEKLRNFEGGWAFRSYTLLRNIVEAQEKYKNLMTMRGNIFENASDIFRANERRRLKIKAELLAHLNSGYDPNQLTLFDYAKMLDQEEKKEAESKEQKPLQENNPLPKPKKPVFRIKDIPTYSEVPMAEKRKFTMGILSNLPRDTFKEVDGGKKIEFNTEMFFVPIDDYHQMCFNQYLTKSMKRRVLFINRTNALITEEHSKGNYYTAQSEEELYLEQRSLNRYFYNHDDELNRAYAWCRLYDEYRDLELQYCSRNQENGEKSGSGAYVKKRDGENYS